MQAFFKTAQIAYAYLLLMLLTPSALLGSGCPSDCSSCIVNRYANTQEITLPAPSDTGGPNKQGVLSPSQILVNNIPKCHVIKGLEVTLQDLLYPQANRLTVALLSPCGDCIILLNEVGENTAQFGEEPEEGDERPVTLVFSDCKGTTLSCSESGPIGPNETLLRQPTDCAPGSYCFNGALDTTFCTTKLSKTFGKPAVGCWQLFTCIKPVLASMTQESGSIGSWKLRIVHGLRAKDGCFDLFTSNCCGPCIC